MNITKDRMKTWERVGDNDYDKELDDELMIELEYGETSREMGDYILKCQEKAKDYDKLEKIVFDLTQRLKECENKK